MTELHRKNLPLEKLGNVRPKGLQLQVLLQSGKPVPKRLTGMVVLKDLLQARPRSLEDERHRERVLPVHLPLSVKKPAAPAAR